MKTSSSINGSLGDNFASGSLWEVVRTIKFCMKNVGLLAFGTPMIVDEERSFIGGEFRWVVF